MACNDGHIEPQDAALKTLRLFCRSPRCRQVCKMAWFVDPRSFNLGSRFVALQELLACSVAAFTNQLIEWLWQRYLIGSYISFEGRGDGRDRDWVWYFLHVVWARKLFLRPLSFIFASLSSFSVQMLVSLGIQQRLLRFLERSRMSGTCSQQSSVSSVPSTARTNDSVVSEHCVRILNKLKTRGNETWDFFERGHKASSPRGRPTAITCADGGLQNISSW